MSQPDPTKGATPEGVLDLLTRAIEHMEGMGGPDSTLEASFPIDVPLSEADAMNWRSLRLTAARLGVLQDDPATHALPVLKAFLRGARRGGGNTSVNPHASQQEGGNVALQSLATAMHAARADMLDGVLLVALVPGKPVQFIGASADKLPGLVEMAKALIAKIEDAATKGKN